VRRALAVALSLLAVPSAVARGDCVPRTSADGVPVRPGPDVRMGLTPAGEAGALGPKVPVTPIDMSKTYAALARLRPPGDAPFVLRLNRLFWSDGEGGLARFADAVAGYTSRGYDVELQVRYHPPAGHDGDVDGFVAFVREVVRRFGPNPRVVGLQVTNEVNFTISPDSSDGAYKNARLALVRGVVAAKDEATRLGFGQLTIGFNWFFRTDPRNEDAFWNGLWADGGQAFVRAVDWVGLDVYPGTVFPPVEEPGGERDGMVAALDDLRTCKMPLAHLGPTVPIHVEENGWPTGPGRSEDHQASALRTMVSTVDEFRGTYGVTDYRWFDLRDHNTSSDNFQHHYGLLRDDYSPKPAFAVYRSLVAARSLRPPAARLLLHLARARRGCGARLSVVGADAASVRRVVGRVALRASRRRTLRVGVDAALADGRVVRVVRRVKPCRAGSAPAPRGRARPTRRPRHPVAAATPRPLPA
jgi:hypothetical protein